MEFYRTINKSATADDLQVSIAISDLPKFCESIYEVVYDDGNHGEINCVWGVFIIHREIIKNGLRFTMPGCPNAFAWTVTAENNDNKIVLHMSTNQHEHEEEFVESLDQFADDWETGLNDVFD